MLKQMLMRKMMQHQMKGVPKEQQEQIIGMVEKDPAFFENLAGEIQAKMKEGKDQQTAAMEVMMQHKDKLQGLMK